MSSLTGELIMNLHICNGLQRYIIKTSFPHIIHTFSLLRPAKRFSLKPQEGQSGPLIWRDGHGCLAPGPSGARDVAEGADAESDCDVRVVVHGETARLELEEWEEWWKKGLKIYSCENDLK